MSDNQMSTASMDGKEEDKSSTHGATSSGDPLQPANSPATLSQERFEKEKEKSLGKLALAEASREHAAGWIPKLEEHIANEGPLPGTAHLQDLLVTFRAMVAEDREISQRIRETILAHGKPSDSEKNEANDMILKLQATVGGLRGLLIMQGVSEEELNRKWS